MFKAVFQYVPLGPLLLAVLLFLLMPFERAEEGSGELVSVPRPVYRFQLDV